VLEISVTGQNLERFCGISAVCSLGTALTLLSISAGSAGTGGAFLDIPRNSYFGGATGLCASAVAVLLFLLERPRFAGIAAGIALGCGVLTAYHRTALFGSSQAVLPFDARDFAASAARDLAMLEILFGATCLPLGLAARRVPPSLGVALLLCLAATLAAGSLAMLLRAALPGPFGGMPSAAAILGGVGVLMLALGLFAYGVRRDDGPMARPVVWLPLLLALAIAVADLFAPGADGLRFGYALVVACGAFFPQRTVTRHYARVSVALAAFGFAASWRGTTPTAIATDIATLGGAIGGILLAERLVDRLLRSELARRNLAQQRDALLTLTHSGCIDLDLTAMTVTPGSGADAIEGLALHQPLAWTDFVASRVAFEHQAAVAASLAAARSGEPPAPLAFQWRRPDGESGEAALCWVPRQDDRATVRGLTGLVQDRARYQRNDRDRADLRARLRTAQKLESLALLSGGVAHDLNNTLVPISVLAPLLFEAVADPADRRSVELIVDAAQRARDLARDMLAYARDDRPTFATIRLDEVVRGSLPLLRARVPAHITLRDAIVPVPEISGNQRQMYQVILNLAVNAAEAIGARAGTITIGTTCTKDADSGAVSAGVFVADDGEGMDAALIKRAFDPFFSTKDGDQATGIGLSIVQRIVQLHGGSVKVDSHAGRGARFDLFFPAGSASEPGSGSKDVEAGDYAEAPLYRR
jgi:signal transduction histidine kinase